MAPWPSPYILMVDRGGCTFVQKVGRLLGQFSTMRVWCQFSHFHFSLFVDKVRNAQRSGAAGVIIADNTCLCSDPDCVSDSQCESTEPIMADDGSGKDISIPSFLMFKTDADQVKKELMDDHPVQLEMSWSLPSPDDRVEYDLWTVPSDPVSKSFLKSFKPFAKALGDRAYFTPHMYVYDGDRTHCRGNDGESVCYNLCTNNGRYCATDPDNDLDKGISGQDVVRESLRRLCIWQYYGEDDGIGEKWWDYVGEFLDRCNSADFFMNEDCVKDCYKHAKIDGDIINNCMTDSGGLVKDQSNSKLDSELDAQAERGIVVLPTAFVNTAAIRGQLSATNVFAAICAGYEEGTRPAICDKCVACSDPLACVTNGVCKGGPASATRTDGVSTHFFATSMLMVIGGFVALGVWHYKKTKEDMREQVRGILAEYMPLEDQEDGASPMDFARRGGTQSLIG